MTDEILLRQLPNFIATGYNETKLIDRISPSVDIASAWTDTHVSPRSILEGFPELTAMHDSITASRALFLAAPLLDVTMHPNGLAVVNTDSMAPASAERSKEFRNALDRQTILLADNLVNKITAYELLPYEENPFREIRKEWKKSYPAINFWLGTVFQCLGQIIEFFHTSYDTALVFHLISKIKARENHIAEHYISPELLEVLRSVDYPDLYITEYSSLLYYLRSAIAESLREPDSSLDPDKMRHIVQLIRSEPDAFAVWHLSATARLFDPPVFRNNKKSGGYFF